MNYRDTLNLPKTDFPMKASLVQLEGRMRKRWDEMDLYGKIRTLRASGRKFVLPDGPPCGNDHIGTGLNKILKDIVVKFRTMQGYNASYVPDGNCLPSGHKVCKQSGERIDDAVREVGADVLRMWISSVDCREDINVSMDIFKRMEEPYRKIRNTLRFLLGNLNDFNPETDVLETGALRELDRWALDASGKLVREVTAAFEKYELHRVFAQIHNFCVVSMSNFYLDIQKDVLYCELPDSRVRRSARTVIYKIADILVRLIAPVLTHTAEEAWQQLPGPRSVESVHLADWPRMDESDPDDRLRERWRRLFSVRTDVYRQIEKLREIKKVSTSAEVSVTLSGSAEIRDFLGSFGEAELRGLLLVSEVHIVEPPPARSVQGLEEPQLAVLVGAGLQPKCARCRNMRADVGSVEGGEDLCARCAGVLQER